MEHYVLLIAIDVNDLVYVMEKTFNDSSLSDKLGWRLGAGSRLLRKVDKNVWFQGEQLN